ncbi:hypothetical protein BKA82DRAFT_1006203 [Pisolithus tinctorius]|uniref:Uncharacterized protein n=1 Tax=Pisolithus tinctorius Marx 270 TaxID=870435 RepID=A0A0C3NNE4_PISTI|nr:hypothetical protein BKA82DRAFT_1006203 [Pisolithus tinctorius]KIN97155.1 hypothetical protein M404DRAFT_1006203 [Pisolithus tinctorius Marx 270]
MPIALQFTQSRNWIWSCFLFRTVPVEPVVSVTSLMGCKTIAELSSRPCYVIL